MVEANIFHNTRLVSFKSHHARALAFQNSSIEQRFPRFLGRRERATRLASTADKHSGYHQSTGRLGKWPNIFGIFSRHHRGRRVCGALFSYVIIKGKWSLPNKTGFTLQLKSKIALGEPKETSKAV